MPDCGLRWRRTEAFVLVGLTCFVVLVTIPLLLASRESSRRSQCRANLRQIGIALNHYMEIHQTLPLAARWTANGLDVGNMDAVPLTGHVTYENWLQLILPQLGEGTLANSFDHSAPATAPQNEKPRTTSLAVLRCPDDAFNDTDNRYRYSDAARNISADFVRGNYAINGGSQAAGRYPGRSSAPIADGYHYEFDREAGTFQWWGNGVAGINRAFGPGEFRNGTSTLVAVDEIRAGIHGVDSRGAWALGHIGGSITFAHGASGDDAGPNSPGDRADDIVGCGSLHELFGPEALGKEGMPCCSYWQTNAQATARSRHKGGVNALFLDGAVRFIPDSIAPTLWHVMHSRETPGDRLDADELELPAKTPVTARRVAARKTITTPNEPRKIVNSIGMELSYIPPGDFIMGRPDQGFDNKVPSETPPHQVRITRPYYMGSYEVTQEQYRRLMLANPSWHDPSRGLKGITSQDTGRMPVEHVSWEDAAEFCWRLSALPEEVRLGHAYRLPTEAEWEYACRAGDDQPHVREPEPSVVTGENIGEHLKTPLNIMAVGSYAPNPFGLYDMRGNVFEWCSDWFERDYYLHSPTDDPQGPNSGFLRVVRGADWLFTGEGCLINRRVSPPWTSSAFLGFRVVATIGARSNPHSPEKPELSGALALYSSHRNPRTMELIRFDPARQTGTLLREAWSASPVWSPDGRQLAFADAKTDIVVTEANGQYPRNLTQKAFPFVKSPTWSPDGRQISFAASPDNTAWSLHVVKNDGSGLRQLANDAANLAMPAWSPDGTRILFVSLRQDKPGVVDLSVVGPDGKKVHRIREDVPFIAAPAWSPNGEQIAFTDWDTAHSGMRLVVANFDGGSQQTIAEDGLNVFPSWSPDGRSIAFVHYESLKSLRGDLMVHDLTSERSTVLSRGTLVFGEDSRPSWLPQNQSSTTPVSVAGGAQPSGAGVR